MKKFVRFILLVGLVLQVNACYPNWYKPHGYIFGKFPKNELLAKGYSQEDVKNARAAFYDGCESGFATAFGNSLYRTFYTWKKDEKLYQNDIYKGTFWYWHGYCRWYVVQTLRNAAMAPPGNIGNVGNLPSLGEHNMTNLWRLPNGVGANGDSGYLSLW